VSNILSELLFETVDVVVSSYVYSLGIIVEWMNDL
jgi:hypothetical protein